MNILAIGLALTCAFGCREPQSQIAVTNAALALEGTHANMIRDSARLSANLPDGFLLSGHKTVVGSGVVLQLKEDHPGRPGRSDSSYFEMVSIYLPLPVLSAGSSVDLEGGDAIVYYSTANYGFLDKGGCHGYARSGKLVIKLITEDEIHAAVDAYIDLVDPSGFEEQCAPTRISGDFVFHRAA